MELSRLNCYTADTLNAPLPHGYEKDGSTLTNVCHLYKTYLIMLP